MDGPDPSDHGSSRLLLIVLAVVAVIGVAFAGASLAMHASSASDASGVKATGAGTGSTTTGSDQTASSSKVTTTSSASVGSTTSSSTSTSSTSTTSTTAVPTATGRFVSAPGSGPVVGTGSVHTYTTEVEEGSGIDPATFDATVDAILADSRSWVGKGYAFQRVPSGGSFAITLATPATTDSICLPLDTAGTFSCHKGHRVVLNLHRWNEGTVDLPLSVADYRAEVINHEVGHELGFGHVGCGGAGLRAPVMMQQSKGLDGCVANPWPTLDGTRP